MEGYLNKRGKRIGSRVRRYMRLEGCFLSNHHAKHLAPTWRVSIKTATITCLLKKHRLTLELYDTRLELYAESPNECEQWYEALAYAKTLASLDDNKKSSNFVRKKIIKNDHHLQDEQKNKENNNVTQVDSGVSEARATHRLTDLSSHFKVVKPENTSACYSDGSDDQLLQQLQEPQQQQTLFFPTSMDLHAGHSSTYEETPASMIFKQFNFPMMNSK